MATTNQGMSRTIPFKLKPRRVLTHLALAGLAVTAYFYTNSLRRLPPNSLFAISQGYLSLLLTSVSLIIGPLQLLLKARWRNPVNLDLRRDIGIWAGITGLIHVYFGLQTRFPYDLILYFFAPSWAGSHLLTDIFGLSNDVGLLATILLLALLATSNNLSLRWLKGPRWKLLQRFNYLLLILIALHTFGYQAISERDDGMQGWTIGLLFLVVCVQGVGYLVYQEGKLKVKGGK